MKVAAENIQADCIYSAKQQIQCFMIESPKNDIVFSILSVFDCTCKQFIQIMDKRTAHNNFHINAAADLQIQLSSSFDSGNLESAILISITDESIPIVKLELIPATDPFNPQYSVKPSAKAFFHFSIKSNKTIKLHACVKKMGILSIIEGSNFQEYYRLCVGKKRSRNELPTYIKEKPEMMQLVHSSEQYNLEFKYQVEEGEKIYFAYHYPYSYEKLCHFLQDLDEHFKSGHEQRHDIENNNNALGGVRGMGIGDAHHIYYRNQLLIESTEGRQINLLTITQAQANGYHNFSRQPRISKSLFPYYDIEERPYKFNKPYIIITSRVHPGQTSASYALQGFIKKLTGSSAQAQFLRKTFVFLIVPMINPDGVFHGTYRMDMLGHNLNRFYNNCAAHKQPSIFAITSLIQHHSEDLVAFFDIHSHPQAKGSFMYGNAYNSIEDQVQSQVFAKLFAINSESFQYEHCTFSQKNMNSKDINDILTKDGSSRVCAYKKMLAANFCNGVHCYALELGYHGCPVKKQPTLVDQIHEFKSIYRRQNKQFNTEDYLEHGLDLLNTLCQVYIQTFRHFPQFMNINQNANNFFQDSTPSANNNNNVTLQTLRQETAKQVYDKDERFRIMDAGLLKKIKNINNIILAGHYTKIAKKYPHIVEYVKEYDAKKHRKQAVKHGRFSVDHNNNNGIKIVHSLQLAKYQQQSSKKVAFHNELIEDDLRKLKQKLPPKNIKNMIFRSNKERMSVVPMQFHIPNPRNLSDNKNIKKREINFNKILEMQAQSLPRIEKKKVNFLTERHRLKQKRIQSSVNANYIQPQFEAIPYSRGGLQKRIVRGMTHHNHANNDKGTIQSNVDYLIQYENMINYQDEEYPDEVQKQFVSATEQYNANSNNYGHNPEVNLQMNMVRNQAMFPKSSLNNHQFIQEQSRKKLEIQFSQKFNRRLDSQQGKDRRRSKSKQKLLSAHIQNTNININQKGKALPQLQLQSKTERIRNNRFDLQLKMKEKYDREYKLDDRMITENLKQ